MRRSLLTVDPHGRRYLGDSMAREPGARCWVEGMVAGRPPRAVRRIDQVTDIDLVNATVTAFAVPHVVAASYAPQGSADAAIVAVSDDPATNPHGHGGVLRSIGPHGVSAVQLASDVNTVAGSPLHLLYSRDGAMVYLSDAGGLWTVSFARAGERARVRHDGSSGVTCSPVRWWDAHTILVSCDEPPGSRLWLAPDDGGTATALSAPAGQDLAIAPDWGSFDAVRTAGGQIFVQRPATCGSVDIATLDAAGRAHHLAFRAHLAPTG